VDLPEELGWLKKFHGHLGPYVTIGLRMGQVAKRELGDYRGMSAIVYCSLVPPVRCLLDGVQMSSGCTFGKANIKVKPGANPKAVFTKAGRTLTIELKEGLRRAIDSEMSKAQEEEQSLRYYQTPESDLLEIWLA